MYILNIYLIYIPVHYVLIFTLPSLFLTLLLTINLRACAAYLLIHKLICTWRIQRLPYAHRCLVKMAGSALWYM